MKVRSKRNRVWKLLIICVSVVLGIAFTLVVIYQRDIRTAHRNVAERSKLVETSYGCIEYGETGEGPPVLILHGAGGGYDQGLLLGQIFLGDNVHVIAPSRFGYLRSEQPQDSTLEAQADILAALLDELGLERVAVMAISAGGPSSLYFARRHPERTAALIMANAISYTIPLAEEDIKKMDLIHRVIYSDFSFWIMLKTLRKPMLNLLGVPHEVLGNLSRKDQTFVNQTLELMLPISSRIPGMLLDESRQIPPDFAYEQITAPTLVLHARDDILVPVEQGINAGTRIPRAEMVVFAKGGHFMIGKTEELQMTISEFFKTYLTDPYIEQ